MSDELGGLYEGDHGPRLSEEFPGLGSHAVVEIEESQVVKGVGLQEEEGVAGDVPVDDEG